MSPPANDTQSRLLDAAAALLWERSFQAASVDELCLRAEAKKGSFYHFFPSKTDLAIAAIERSWANVKRTIFEPIFSNTLTSGLDQLHRLVENVHAFQLQTAKDKGEYLGCPFGNLGQEMACQDERLRITLAKIFEEHYDYIEGALLKAQQAGEIVSSDTRGRAKQILAVMEGAMLLAKVSNDPQIFRDIGGTVQAIAAGSEGNR